MKITDVPSRFNIPFANSAGGGYIRPIPEASQVGIQDGAASLTTGFPPLNFLPVGAGGVPPFGQDFNGLCKQITQWNQWQAAGGLAPYNSDFSTAIGGYPKNAVLMASSANNLWLNLVDDNTSNPDTGGANWMPLGLAATQPEVTAGIRTDVFVSPATLAGNNPGYADLTATLPIYFEVETANAQFGCTSPSTGTVRVPAGVSFVWRGVRRFTTVQTNLATVANKTYHLRWTNDAGFALYDLSSGAYNPTSAAETSSIFDTTYDSMLVARVVTNGSNVLAITNLANRSRLLTTQTIAATNILNPGTNGTTGDISMSINWARTPLSKSWCYMFINYQNGFDDADVRFFALGTSSPIIYEIPATRYSSTYTMNSDWALTWYVGMTMGA